MDGPILPGDAAVSPLPSADADRLDDYRFQFGHDAGNLSLALDQLTDALTLVNQHSVYGRGERGARAGEPPPDVAELIRLIGVTKGLVQESLARLKATT
jgi:hypothetical protein